MIAATETDGAFIIEGVVPSMGLHLGCKVQVHGRAGFLQVTAIDNDAHTAQAVPCDPPGANRKERRRNLKRAIIAAAQVARDARKAQ